MSGRLPDAGTVRGAISAEIMKHRGLLVPPVLETGALRKEGNWWADFRSQLGFAVEDWVGPDMQPGPSVDLVVKLGELEGTLPIDTYGSVLCAETFEHVAEPFLALLDLMAAMKSWRVDLGNYAICVSDPRLS